MSDDMFAKKIADCVGKNNFDDSLETRERYSLHMGIGPSSLPDYIVYPQSREQVREIAFLANEYGIPLTPKSSKISLFDCSTPSVGRGGVIIDFSRMDKILSIDEVNWHVTVEPGVSFKELQEELSRRELRVPVPLFCSPHASVISNLLERNPVVTSAHFTYGNELVTTFEVVLPEGDLFTVGHPSPDPNIALGSCGGPGLNFYRLFFGAQGTLGIITKMIIRAIPLPKKNLVHIIPCNDVRGAIKIMSEIQKKEIGIECFALNAFNFAILLTQEERGNRQDMLNTLFYLESIRDNPHSYYDTRALEVVNHYVEVLPSWVIILRLCGFKRFPNEKIRYEEEVVREIIDRNEVKESHFLENYHNLSEIILDEITLPWRMQGRFGYKGSCENIMFYTKAQNIFKLQNVIHEICLESSYPLGDIGGYIMPVERGRSFYCEYHFYYCKKNMSDFGKMSSLSKSMCHSLMRQGAFFDRPYGHLAELVYKEAKTYHFWLKQVKDKFDPNNIMNPGKLGFN